jgi:hypothetical protein
MGKEDHMEWKSQPGIIGATIFWFVLVCLAGVLLFAGGAEPICQSIFPPSELIPAGGQMAERTRVYDIDDTTLALFKHGAELYWTWDGVAPAWFQSPDWSGPYHYERRLYRAYCRHQGHIEWCATDCWTFQDETMIYTRLYYEGDAWAVYQRTWDTR